MITVYFEKPIDDNQALDFYDAGCAEIKGDYLVLTGAIEDEDSDEDICSYEVVGMFLMKNVLGWVKNQLTKSEHYAIITIEREANKMRTYTYFYKFADGYTCWYAFKLRGPREKMK